MANQSEVQNKKTLDELTKCPVCQGDCRTPTALPCLHTFCRECLANVSKESLIPGVVECPVCLDQSVIPADDGVAGFKHNAFIEMIINSSKLDVDAAQTQLDADIDLVTSCATNLHRKATELDTSTKAFMAEARNASDRIKECGEKIKAFVDQQVGKLLEEIRAMRNEAAADNKARKTLIEATVAEMDKFKLKAFEAKSQSADVKTALHEEVDNLTNMYIKASDFTKRVLVFNPLDVQDLLTKELGTKNWFGEVAVSRRSALDRVFALYDCEVEGESRQLGCQFGDTMNVISKVHHDWMSAELNGKTGLVAADRVVDMSVIDEMSSWKQTNSDETAVALYNHESRNSHELAFNKGDVITVGRKLNADWWIGTTGGNTGLVLSNHVASLACLTPSQKTTTTSDDAMAAQFEYKAENEYELDLPLGDVINVISKLNADWSVGEIGGKVGLFMNHYVSAFSDF